MNLAEIRSVALEIRGSASAFQGERSVSSSGAVVVSGMLAEQLVRELGAGARPGAVRLGDQSALSGAVVAVRVIAGDPSDADTAFVDAADRAVVPVVLVQLWAQEVWRAPFVLTPFVVECRTGEGFPVPEIAARIAEAADEAPALAARIPMLAGAVERAVVRATVVRSAVLALSRKPGSRPRIALEQVRMVSRLRALAAPDEPDPGPVVAAAATGSFLVSHALRVVARSAGRSLPSPLANAAVAGAGTWAIYRLTRELEARLPRT